MSPRAVLELKPGDRITYRIPRGYNGSGTVEAVGRGGLWVRVSFITPGRIGVRARRVPCDRIIGRAATA